MGEPGAALVWGGHDDCLPVSPLVDWGNLAHFSYADLFPALCLDPSSSPRPGLSPERHVEHI